MRKDELEKEVDRLETLAAKHANRCQELEKAVIRANEGKTSLKAIIARMEIELASLRGYAQRCIQGDNIPSAEKPSPTDRDYCETYPVRDTQTRPQFSLPDSGRPEVHYEIEGMFGRAKTKETPWFEL